ncbi:hypothetical protein IE996_13965 [Klebsiella pneumoniae]|uniref:Uncharacterized protein n=1 Tax=Klebsiella pneumoniae TaxID=573 RepID=A0A927DBM7_KLEPN|nr:hypothetical protein [Klebsiella pneumoniae]MBD3702115.1 hypothetical protein [Klebsiella pneumoniae]MBD3709380.1 hypothetical protein [Klebsiella pneumoniae]
MPGGAALARPTELAPACRTPRPGKAQPPPGIRPGTRPAHLAGRRGACPAY